MTKTTAIQLFDEKQIRIVFMRDARSGDAMNRVSTEGMTSGIYVLRLINGNYVKTQRIVVE